MSEEVRVSIVLPVYNEEECIADVLERLRTTLREHKIKAELICVDDGSTDRTSEILGSTDGIEVVGMGRNNGYGAALKAGFLHSSADVIVTLDADRTYPPEELPRLLDALEENVDMVVGTRFGEPSSEMELTRSIGNRLFVWLTRLLYRERVTDVCTGMRVVRKEFLERVSHQECSDDLDFALQLSLRALLVEASIREVPISYRKRSGRSKLSVLRHGFRFLGRIIRERFTYRFRHD